VLVLTALFGRTAFVNGLSSWIVWFSVLAVILTVASGITLIVGEGFEFPRRRLEPRT